MVNESEDMLSLQKRPSSNRPLPVYGPADCFPSCTQTWPLPTAKLRNSTRVEIDFGEWTDIRQMRFPSAVTSQAPALRALGGNWRCTPVLRRGPDDEASPAR